MIELGIRRSLLYSNLAMNSSNVFKFDKCVNIQRPKRAAHHTLHKRLDALPGGFGLAQEVGAGFAEELVDSGAHVAGMNGGKGTRRDGEMVR